MNVGVRGRADCVFSIASLERTLPSCGEAALARAETQQWPWFAHLPYTG